VDSLEGIDSSFELLVLGGESIEQEMGRTYIFRTDRERGIAYELKILDQLSAQASGVRHTQ
jgi:hypothetical protein